jgi:hypothetical protein
VAPGSSGAPLGPPVFRWLNQLVTAALVAAVPLNAQSAGNPEV